MKEETKTSRPEEPGYQIIPIDAHTWRIEDNGVRFFVLEGTEKALLIDSGMQVHNAREITEGLTKLPVSLLNTHADPDHVGSNAEFPVFYMHPAEASNYYNTHRKTGQFIPVHDGEMLDLGNRLLQIITLPGHTPGSIAVLDKNARVVFSGDSIQNGRIFMFGVQREIHAYMHSLVKLQGYGDEFDKIYPSHGSFPVEPSIIPELYKAAGKILSGEAEGAMETAMFGQKVKRYDMGVAVFLCDSEV